MIAEHKHEVCAVAMREIAGQTVIVQTCECGATRTIIYAGPGATPSAWEAVKS